MNVELLKEFCEKILEFEEAYAVQNSLESLRSSMDALAGNPQDQAQQKNVSNSLKSLQDAIISFENEFSPKEKERLREVQGYSYFSADFVSEIKNKISENALSPAVVRDHINGISKKRQQYIDNLKALIASLDKIGIEISDLEDDETEIGFQIPRDIFNNNLEGLIKELSAIKGIVRTFSEVTTGTVEDIKVGQISTSDPLIFLAQSLPVILAIAKAVDWSLAKWKEVEEIRNLRAQTAQIKHFTQKEVSGFYDKKIKEIVDTGIEEKAKEILSNCALEQARKNELQKALKHALESLFARIERGMTIEIRMLPYEEEEAEEGASEDAEEGDASSPTTINSQKELENIQVSLKFPAPNPNPILKLPAANNGENKKPAESE